MMRGVSLSDLQYLAIIFEQSTETIAITVVYTNMAFIWKESVSTFFMVTA